MFYFMRDQRTGWTVHQYSESFCHAEIVEWCETREEAEALIDILYAQDVS